MYNILMYSLISFGSFWTGFFLCAILTNSKNREYTAIKTWQKEFKGKDILHDGKNYLVKL